MHRSSGVSNLFRNLCYVCGGQNVADRYIMVAIFDLSNWGVSSNLSKLMMSGCFGT